MADEQLLRYPNIITGVIFYIISGIIWLCSTKYMISKRISQALGKRLQIVSLLLQVMFCNPSSRPSTNDVPLVK